jgi:hypothetical protein
LTDHGEAFPPPASTPSQALDQPAFKCGMLLSVLLSLM